MLIMACELYEYLSLGWRGKDGFCISTSPKHPLVSLRITHSFTIHVYNAFI